MNRVIVRTKLQAIIVKKMVDTKLIIGDLHVVQVHEDDADDSRFDVAYQCQSFAPITRSTTILARRNGTLSLFLYFWRMLLESRIRHQRVYFGNINWFSFALALKLSPGQRIFSFDDGSANIQRRDSSYLSHSPTKRHGARGAFARWIFPNGCACYVRSRIERHCTIYPGIENIVPQSKIDTIEIDWAGMIAHDDLSKLPENATKIFLGSVYPSINNRVSGTITEQEVEIVAKWADLHIPHPRHSRGQKSSIFLKYPAESIISHYAKKHDVIVAHYNSSATLSFRHNNHVRLIDLMEVPTSSLWSDS